MFPLSTKVSPVDRPQKLWQNSPVDMPQEKPEILPGTLDLMVLKTLAVLGPLHGFGLARRIEQISANLIELNQGTIYASLLRLQQRGWISSAWGVSENNRKAKFYSITRAGQKNLAAETRSWERTSGMMTRLLALEPGD
jgi:PadR family transcriptional regulator, regulatory protein PadR